MTVFDQSNVENMRRLAVELDEEEQELWRQLRRKRDFEARVAEKRAQLHDLRERRRNASAAHAEGTASVDHLTTELTFTQEQEKELDDDIATLKDSNRILHQTFQQAMKMSGGPVTPPSLADNRDAKEVYAEERKRQEAMQLQHQQINHLRAHLEKLRAEKSNLLMRQSVLFDKQRSAEQDRNRLLGTLQDDRSIINEVRQERIRLWEERSKMEREMAQIVRDAQAGALAPAGAAALGTSGGARGKPQVAGYGGRSPGQGSPTAAGDGPVRPHWTGFGDAPTSPNRAPLVAGYPTMPPSFGDLTATLGSQAGVSGGGEATPAITEWAGKMRDFRDSGRF